MIRYVRTKTGQGFVPFRSVRVEKPDEEGEIRVPGGRAGEADGRPASGRTGERGPERVGAPAFAPLAGRVARSGSERGPARASQPQRDAGCRPARPFVAGTQLVFDLYSATQLVGDATGARPLERVARSEDRVTLVNLAACMASDGSGGWVPHPEATLAFARVSGPLLGGEDGRESWREWAYAADTAMVAVRLQECINDRQPVSSLDAFGRVQKMRLRIEGSDAVISSYGVAFMALRPSASMLLQLPFIRRTTNGGMFQYAFVSATDGAPAAKDGIVPLECLVISLSEEPADAEFALLCEALGLDAPNAAAPNAAAAPGTAVDPADRLDPAGDARTPSPAVTVLPDAEFDDGDKPALEALVQAMAVANLGETRVDMYRGDRVTGFLSFDTLYGWMWYDFACDAQVAAMGYCEWCGRAFSLVGNRGVARRYCSQACKTAAKNERTRGQKKRCRALFAAGEPVIRIAAEVYGGASGTEDRVRGDLSQWVELKHRIDDELQEGGTDLLMRCAGEGLDMRKLLSARRLSKLQEVLNRRDR